MGHPQCLLNGRMSVFGCQVYLNFISKFQWFQENAEDYFDVPFLFICNHKALSYIAWHVWKDLLIGVFQFAKWPHWPCVFLIFVHWRALQTPSIVIHSSTFVNIFFKMDVSVHKASRINRCFDFLFWCGTLFPVQDWAVPGCSQTVWTFFEVNVAVHKVSCWCFDSCSDVQLFPSARLKQRMGVAQHCADSSRWTFQFTMWAVWICVLFVLKPEHSER